MTKEEIFDELEKLDLPKDKYIVISGASLVCQGLIEKTNDIDLACSKDFFEKLEWPVRVEHNSKIKYKSIALLYTVYVKLYFVTIAPFKLSFIIIHNFAINFPHS